jgi:DNA-binding MarR family transcriptional regulator
MAARTADGEVRLGALDALVGYHMRRASAIFVTDFTRAVGDIGLRQVLFGILSIVEANPGINQGAAGRALGIQRANMVSLVNELTDRGLLTRDTAAEDRRALALTLTDAGRALFAEGRRRLEAHEATLLRILNAEERATLLELLSRIEAAEN